MLESFIYMWMKSYFHMKGWATRLALRKKCRLSEKRIIQPKIPELQGGKSHITVIHGKNFAKKFVALPRKVVLFSGNFAKCRCIRHRKFLEIQTVIFCWMGFRIRMVFIFEKTVDSIALSCLWNTQKTQSFFGCELNSTFKPTRSNVCLVVLCHNLLAIQIC